MATGILGRNMTFPIYSWDDGYFLGLELKKATVDSVVMSLADKITGDVYYKGTNMPLTMREYIVYNGVKYVLVNPPTIVCNGTVSEAGGAAGMTKYSFEFYHPMFQLSNLPFCDVATSSDSQRYLSENKVFSWIGYPQDFIDKLNKNLEDTQWVCVMSGNIPADKLRMLSSVLPFDKNTIADALKTWYDTWELPFVIDVVEENESYYARGKRFKVVMGLPSNEIYNYSQGHSTGVPYVFRMGKGLGLKNNSRTPRNNKIITRIAGYGSEDNIPYGYPQIVWEGNPDWDYTIDNDSTNPHSYPLYMGIVNGEYVKLIKHPFTRTYLMPSVYTERVNKKVNPYANGYNPNIELVDYYDAIGEDFENEINPLAPSYENHAFEHIKPELGEASIDGAVPLNEDLSVASEWDDTMDDNGDYVQSYFQMTLPVLQFDIYACAAITQEMKVNMRSGACLGCTFTIQVDWDLYKQNFYDADGNFAPDGEQRDFDLFPDSSQDSINIVLKKEIETFGTLMPNRYQRPARGDKFVILGISLPLSYIRAAEQRLDDEMYSYMLLNNVYYFDYPLKFDEHFLATHTAILSQIRPNTIVRFMFNNKELQLYVRQLTIKFGEKPLPQYDITLTDNIEVATNQIGKVSDNVDKLAALLALTRQNQGIAIQEGSADKLSRVYDDEAHGLIGFLKGAWFGSRQWIIDALGNANLNNVTANGILRALNAYINNVRSTNYTGEGMLDTGWQIRADYEGSNSKAVFDYLYIRKKAVFEALEIRKLSYIGGNFCLSPASGRAWRVEVYDAVDGGELLGYDEYTVPWMLGGKVLSLFSHNAANRFLSKKKRIARTLTEEERQRMKRVRVYMFSDDGTTKTMQNWTKNAQARCQTFNIEEQMDYHGSGEDTDNPDVSFWTGDKVQNTYWWRLVWNVGEALCGDGKKHSYVEFLVNQPNERTHADVGSDIPAVGDEFVQFGHRTREDQSNVIMIETANADSPAIKFYHGINSWNLNNKRCIIFSPTIVEMRAAMFRWITEYGASMGQTINRGLWVDIPFDDDGHRRCYYNDIVSHNGAAWRCVVADGMHKEDASGHWYTDAEYDALPLEEQMGLIDVQNYTTDEPSETSGDWEKYVYASIAPYVKLSEALIAVPCEKNRRASAVLSKTVTVKLMVTNLEATITRVTLEGGDSIVSKSGNNIVVSVAANTVVTNKDYNITVEGTLDGQEYVAMTSLSVYAVLRGNDAYEVSSDPVTWIWAQSGANMSSEELLELFKRDELPTSFEMDIDKSRTGNSSAGILVLLDGSEQPCEITSAVPSVNTVEVQHDQGAGTGRRVWVTAVPNNLENGYVDVTVRYGNAAERTLRILFHCNLLGTWRTTIIGDTELAIADRTKYLDDQYTEFHAEYVRSSQEATSKFSAITGIIGENGEKIVTQTEFGIYKQTASQNLATLESNVNTELGKKLNTSEFLQTAQGFSLCTTSQAQSYADNAESDAKTAAQGYASSAESNAKTHANNINTNIRNDIKKTGIVIDGNNSHIDIIAGKVNFYKSDGSTPANIYFNTTDDLFKIGGFFITAKSLSTDKSDTNDNRVRTQLSTDGFLFLSQATSTANCLVASGGNSTIDGEKIAINGNTSVSINNVRTGNITIGQKSSSGTLFLGSSTINIESSSTISLKGNQINVGESGYHTVLSGYVSFPSACLFVNSTQTVNLNTQFPNPKSGQVIFARGVGGNLTMTGSFVDTNGSTQTSLGGDKKPRILVRSSTGYWQEFYCG